jgi:hypothetical protein
MSVLTGDIELVCVVCNLIGHVLERWVHVAVHIS